MFGSDERLDRLYDVALLDLDGVVYLGREPIPAAPDSLAEARRQGMRLAFVTNNAARTPDQVAELLNSMHVTARPEEVVTSSQAAARALAERLPAGSAVLVIGTEGLVQALTERGLRPVFSADDSPAAVVQGYSPDLNWHQLAEGMVAIRQGAYWLATNLDSTVPSARGPLPGNGSLVAALAHAVGRTPPATGKPDPTMHAESVSRSGATHPIVVGDRLDTDIEGARRVGCDSLLVFSGVTTVADLLGAEALHRPDFLGPDLSALNRVHPVVTVDDAGARCGQAEVTVSATTLTVAGDPGPDGLDRVRAVVAAAWRLADRGATVSGVRMADGCDAPELTELSEAAGTVGS